MYGARHSEIQTNRGANKTFITASVSMFKTEQKRKKETVKWLGCLSHSNKAFALSLIESLI